MQSVGHPRLTLWLTAVHGYVHMWLALAGESPGLCREATCQRLLGGVEADINNVVLGKRLWRIDTKEGTGNCWGLD